MLDADIRSYGKTRLKEKQVAERIYRKYKFYNPDGTVNRSGISKRPLQERERELRREENLPKGRIRQVGRATTEEAARDWEKQQRTGTPPGGKRRQK